MLTKTEIIEGLKYHNEWRRGAEIEMLNPSDLGELIDGAINLLERSDNSEYMICLELINGAKPLIEIAKMDGKHNQQWKKDWIEKANNLLRKKNEM